MEFTSLNTLIVTAFAGVTTVAGIDTYNQIEEESLHKIINIHASYIKKASTQNYIIRKNNLIGKSVPVENCADVSKLFLEPLNESFVITTIEEDDTTDTCQISSSINDKNYKATFSIKKIT